MEAPRGSGLPRPEWAVSLLRVLSESRILPLSKKNRLFLSKRTGVWGGSTSEGDNGVKNLRKWHISAHIRAVGCSGPRKGADDCDRHGGSGAGGPGWFWGACI